jgi:hypothetical protein
LTVSALGVPTTAPIAAALPPTVLDETALEDGYAQAAGYMPFSRLVADAPRIAVGAVAANLVYWENGKIFTESTVQVKSVLKGPQADNLVVKNLGGCVDGVCMRVADAPELHAGEEHLLFLEGEDHASLLVGGPAAVWPVVQDGSGDTHVYWRTGRGVEKVSLGSVMRIVAQLAPAGAGPAPDISLKPAANVAPSSLLVDPTSTNPTVPATQPR